MLGSLRMKGPYEKTKSIIREYPGHLEDKEVRKCVATEDFDSIAQSHRPMMLLH